MKILFVLSFLFSGMTALAQNIQLNDATTSDPVAYATISFGNGLGTFANGDGVFKFSRKVYTGVDSLFITSLGYKDLAIAVSDLKSPLLLEQQTSELATVVINASLTGDFKTMEIEPVAHDIYEDCWLPTVESEIAVKFSRPDGLPTQITHLQLPILLEKNGGRKNAGMRKFSTMFRVQFYDITEDDIPENQTSHPTMTFVIDNTSKPIYELDITTLNITIPKNGLYVAIQALGYTTPDGELINAKKFREVKTQRGIKRISNTYRPLLPFTKKESADRVMVRRVFFNDKQWQPLDLEYNRLSKLVRSGHTSYGMGATLRVFQN